MPTFNFFTGSTTGFNLNSRDLLLSRMSHQDSTSALLATTMILSLTSLGYIFHYFQKKIEHLEQTKKDIDEEEHLEEDVYQSWLGTFADGTNSMVATLVWKKESSRKENANWIEWNREQDGSVINRNFYLGNESPSFDWLLTNREADTKGVVNETFMDGWNSVIQLNLTAFVKEPKTKEGMNLFLGDLLQQERIDWQRCMLTKQEVTEIFE